MSNVIINRKITFVPTSINLEAKEVFYVVVSGTGTRKMVWGYGSDKSYYRARLIKGGSGNVKLSDEQTAKLSYMLVCAIKDWRMEEGRNATMREFAEKSFTITRQKLDEFELPKEVNDLEGDDDTQCGVIPF